MAKWEESEPIGKPSLHSIIGLGTDNFFCQAWMKCWHWASLLGRQVGCRYLHSSQVLRNVAARFWVGDWRVQNRSAPGVLSQGELHGHSGPPRDPTRLSSLEFKETVGLCRLFGTDSNYQMLSLELPSLCVHKLEPLGISATGPSLLKKTHLGTMEMLLLGLHVLSWKRPCALVSDRNRSKLTLYELSLSKFSRLTDAISSG